VVAPHAYGSAKCEVMRGINVDRFVYMLPVKFQRVAYGGGIPSKLKKYSLVRLLFPQFFFSFLIKSLLTSRHCDVIHAHWTFSGLVGLLMGRLYRRPVVLTVHGSDLNLLPNSGLIRKAARFILSKMDAIICVSHDLREKILGLISDHNKVVVIPNGVDLDSFPKPENPPQFEKMIWVGRMTPEKGLAYLIQAMRKVVDAFPNTHLDLVGDGELRPSFETQVAELGLSENIHFLGAQPYSDVPLFVNKADLFVLPSLREGLPLVLLEAMAMARPVVASAVGGIPEICPADETIPPVRLVAPTDVDALSQAILDILNQPQLALAMGENGRRIIFEHYTWSGLAARTLEVYKATLHHYKD
ncbi:MAG: glycosyltransferase, partial [Chloroflexota bacterium]